MPAILTVLFFIFSRDDVVLALLQRGALVKIVNNKGQTPVSLAASHLHETTIGDRHTINTHTLLIHPINTPYRHTLSILPFST